MIQGTYDRASNHTFLDNTDIRYADTASHFGLDLIYGVSVNNNPTVQDVWNTTPAWGFPYIASTIAPQFAPPGTTIEGALGGRVVGTGIYTFWNDMLYLEGSVYQNLSRQALEALGDIITKEEACGLEVTLAAVRETLETNTLAPLYLSQALVPLVKRSKAGRIVNISCGMGQLSEMKGGYALNSDAKCNTQRSKWRCGSIAIILPAEGGCTRPIQDR